jgi:sodium/bile acid cotransporter 7
MLAAIKFPLLLLAVAGAAVLFPGPGSSGGIFYPEITRSLAVFIIFFLNGLALPTRKIWEGVRNWRVHMFVHLCLFGLGPLLAWLLGRAAGGMLPQETALGLFYLGALPCAISSVVVFSAISGGNTAAAFFNSIVSNLAGVLLLPLLVATQIELDGSRAHVVAGMIGRTALTVFPPLLLGQLLQAPLKFLVERSQAWFGRANHFFILLLAFFSYSQMTADGRWQEFSAASLAGVGLLVLLFLALLCLGVWGGLRLARFTRPDATAAFYCSTLKTLAAGIPLADAIFRGTSVDTGTVLLPLLVYSIVSLSLASVWSKACTVRHW